MFKASLVSPRFTLLAIAVMAWLGGLSLAQDFPDFGDFGGTGFGAPQAEVNVEAQFTAPTDERPAMLFVTAKISEGYHVYAVDQGVLPNGGGGPMATSIALSGNDARVVGPWRSIEAPETHIDQEIWPSLEIREHANQVTWYAPLELSPGTDTNTLSLTATIEGQACNPQTCIPFEQQFTAKQGAGMAVPENSQQTTETQSDSDMSLLSLVAYAMLGGLILNLMPCVLPVIGLKVLSFAKQGGQSRAQILLLNISYAAGILAVFLFLATLASLVQLGIGSENLGWGELNTHTWFKVSMSALVFAMALSFLGTWELPIPGFASSSKATDLSSREGPLGAFMMGVFTTILATPCSGPYLGPVFGYLISQPPHITYAIFGAVGLGMALPYLLIGCFPSLVNWLPKPGMWMETFKQLLGFVLLGTVVWLMSAISSDYFIATLTLLFAIWFACWWIGRTPITAPTSTKRTAWLGGITVAAVVGFAAFKIMTPGESVLPWQPYSKAALAEARAQGKTVMVDFTAQWCLTCKTNLKLAINREEVKESVEQNGVVTLLADWTDKDPVIKQALLEHNSQSIPLLVIYPADTSRPPIVLRDLLSKGDVLSGLAEAGPSIGFGGESELATAPTTTEVGGRYQQESTVQ